jgi:5-methyltetrahydrofolate--homocysteine methyltransferase
VAAEVTGEAEILRNIADALADLNATGLRAQVTRALAAGIPVRELIQEGLGTGMRLVGERYERGEYFLSELIMASLTMTEALELLTPQLQTALEPIGTVVIGTVEGDLHDIGKNIVTSMLESAGFHVHDLGVDVPPARFVEIVRKVAPNLLCLSTLLSVTIPKVRETIVTLDAEGLRGRVRVLVGGRCLNRELARTLGADAYGQDAWAAVKEAKRLLAADDR